MILRGSRSILQETLYFCDFSGGPDPLPPSGSAHGMHLKDGTCLKCYCQRVVIIGRQVGLDYNSWYACLSLIRHVGSKLFANLAGLVVKLERERERETARCLHTNLLFWLGFLEYRNAMFGSVNQSWNNCFR